MEKLDCFILDDIYEDIEDKIKEIVNDFSYSSFFAILECISLVSTYLEVYKIQEKRLPGQKKKTICKEFMLQKVLSLVDDERKDDFIEIINYSADHVIELIINFAKSNKVINKSKKCLKSACV